MAAWKSRLVSVSEEDIVDGCGEVMEEGFDRVRSSGGLM